MATTTRQATKTISMPPAGEESVPEPVTQRTSETCPLAWEMTTDLQTEGTAYG